MMKEADELRVYMAREPYSVIIGGAGGCQEKLGRVLDRLDELEWIVATMRGLPSLPNKEQSNAG
jgi:hypothetical protein